MNYTKQGKKTVFYLYFTKYGLFDFSVCQSASIVKNTNLGLCSCALNSKFQITATINAIYSGSRLLINTILAANSQLILQCLVSIVQIGSSHCY